MLIGNQPRPKCSCKRGICGIFGDCFPCLRVRRGEGRGAGHRNPAREACSTCSPLLAQASSSSDEGPAANSHSVSWSSLPDDMVEVILAHFSLIELARISPTCSVIYAIYRERIAVQQKSRMDLASSLFSTGQIACIVALIVHLLLGGSLKRDFGVYERKMCRITRDGVLRGPVPCVGSFSTAETGNFCVEICRNRTILQFNFIPMKEDIWSLSYVVVEICHDRKEVMICVGPSHDGELHAVALVQAMLSGGLAPFLSGAGKCGHIHIIRTSVPTVSLAGLEAQIGPLLPFAAYYKGVNRSREDWEWAGERMLVGAVGSPAHEESALGLMRRGWRLGRVSGFRPQYALIRHVLPGGCLQRMWHGRKLMYFQLQSWWES